MRKVLTYGTFDLFHPGHYNILKRAKELGDYLIVGVTGESYDMERGKLSVRDNLVTRIEHVKETGFADEIIIEEYLGQKIHDIIKYNIDVLVVGSDWRGKFDHMNKYCEVVYLERTKDISSTILRQESYQIKKLGIVTESINDNDAVLESKYVSGIHVESVFSEKEKNAAEFCAKYELDRYETDYNAFLAEVDIVYIKNSLENRYLYIKNALLQGKHVISNPTITLDPEKANELFMIAEECNAILLENMPTLYLQAFNQLLWNAKGNLVGDIVSVKCGINKCSLMSSEYANLFECLSLPICVINKMIGDNYDIGVKIVRGENGEPSYAIITDIGKEQNASFVIEAGMNIDVDTSMTILGTAGKIEVPGDWWKTGYFKMQSIEDNNFKRYSSNFEGNGFRYILQSLLSMIDENRVQTLRVVPKETVKVIEILQEIYIKCFGDTTN